MNSFSLKVHAAELTWTQQFNISKIFVSNATNFHYRISGNNADGSPLLLCNSNFEYGKTIAYLNEADSGSKGKISTLLAAYAAQDKVKLGYEIFTAGNGNTFCHIVEIEVHK